MTDCVIDQAGVVEAGGAGSSEAKAVGAVQLKRKRRTRPDGTPTKVLNTPVLPGTMEAIKRVAKQHNVGYGEVIDKLVRSAEKGKEGGGVNRHGAPCSPKPNEMGLSKDYAIDAVTI